MLVDRLDASVGRSCAYLSAVPTQRPADAGDVDHGNGTGRCAVVGGRGLIVWILGDGNNAQEDSDV